MTRIPLVHLSTHFTFEWTLFWFVGHTFHQTIGRFFVCLFMCTRWMVLSIIIIIIRNSFSVMMMIQSNDNDDCEILYLTIQNTKYRWIIMMMPHYQYQHIIIRSNIHISLSVNRYLFDVHYTHTHMKISFLDDQCLFSHQ